MLKRLPEMLDDGSLERELQRRIENAADAYEQQDAEAALRIAKNWKRCRTALMKAGGNPAFSVMPALEAAVFDREPSQSDLQKATGTANLGGLHHVRKLTPAQCVAVTIADEKESDLPAFALTNKTAIESADTEVEIKNRLNKALTDGDGARQRNYAAALAKLWLCKRILKAATAADLASGDPLQALNHAIALTIKPTGDLPESFGGTAKREDDPWGCDGAWEKLLREILGDSYPKLIDANGSLTQPKTKSAVDELQENSAARLRRAEEERGMNQTDIEARRREEALKLARTIKPETDLSKTVFFGFQSHRKREN